MSHQETYRRNQGYTEFLANWDAKFYAKYVDTLRPRKTRARVLDVGCGAGQVLAQLIEKGAEAYGVDVSETNVQRARQYCEHVEVYDGKALPFPDQFFTSTGALNVLEHVDEPEQFIPELVRVTELFGRIILSSPNFFRVLGFLDYHPRMRGFRNKFQNWKRLQEKRRQFVEKPDTVRFDRMNPIYKEPFTPDDDAIIATNPLEMKFFLEKAGCLVETISCTDRYVPKAIDSLLNATPLRFLMFNAFLVATRVK